jgi:N-acetylglucosaminyldiphosphoundecaprenol N-acetyl-beta-D-mannosaminyltransferase
MSDQCETIPNVDILGSRIHLIQLHDVVSQMSQWIQRNEQICRRIVVTGFHGIWEAYQDINFRNILNSADLWIPDGIAPVWIARWKGFSKTTRTPGVYLMRAFLDMAAREGYSSFFYGDTERTLARLVENLNTEYPKLRIAGIFSPPFKTLTQKEDDEIIDMINKAKPDVLWVALGLPKQERWIFEHRDRLHVPVAVGVGAAFGFLSGQVKHAPNWLGDFGLEWLWRLIHEPKKLWKRDLVDGPRFVWHVLWEFAKLKSPH